ncbi:MAG: AraC family transcriptional regulator [Brasilonema angustatum HA4187-MV1]|nr:AraC family transcriptional regulator [Brasilonema angustatum HA4187-MV1]
MLIRQSEAEAVGDIAHIAALRQNLIAKISRWTESEPDKLTAVPGLVLYKRPQPTVETCEFHLPGLALIVQGSKKVQLGGESYTYDESHFLLTTVDLPTINQVVKATRSRPYLSAVLRLNLQAARQLILDYDLDTMRSMSVMRAIGTGPATGKVFDAFIRMLDLLDQPQDIPILAPLIERELLYRLLTSEEGKRLRAVVSSGSQSSRIAKAVAWFKENYREPLRVKELAQSVHMGVSTFHHHFRAMTALSPLQYQKQLRLHEARRLMLLEEFDVASAAANVGYESSTQFSREYSRLFGQSASSDIKLFRISHKL